MLLSLLVYNVTSLQIKFIKLSSSVSKNVFLISSFNLVSVIILFLMHSAIIP